MSTVEINSFLKARLRDFDGVFSIDNLPDDPHLLVCNTDCSNKHGRHWMAIYVEDGRGEYFYSFGRRPSAAFDHYMNSHCSLWNYNDRHIQSLVSKNPPFRIFGPTPNLAPTIFECVSDVIFPLVTSLAKSRTLLTFLARW